MKQFSLRLRAGLFLAAYVACGITLAIWFASNFGSFEKCVKETKSDHYYAALQKEHSTLVGARHRVRLNFVCAGHVIDENHDIINTLATVFVSLFTLALWASTRALWVETRKLAEGAEAQSADLKESIKIAQAHAGSAAAAAGSDRAWMCCSLPNPIAGTDSYLEKVHFDKGLQFAALWKNLGRSPAIQMRIYTDHRLISVDLLEAPVFSYNWTEEAILSPSVPPLRYLPLHDF